MIIASLVALSTVVLLALAQLFAALYFRRRFGHAKDLNLDHNWQPHASVVLAIRGKDPSLRATIMGLLDQCYSNYDVFLVVDHHTDQAWELVNDIKHQHDCDDRLNIVELKKPHTKCGLKCSALTQAIAELPEKTELLVLIDADVVPHSSWLSTLVAPLQDSQIGVVTGNHWFEPTTRNVASLVRSAWNAGALVPTAILANPWAGTCAMRMDDVRRTGLVDIWKKSIVDDGPIRDAFKPLGTKIHFVPNLIMLNRESCTGSYVVRYVTRMLTWSRLYEPTFSSTAIHMFITVGSVLGCLGLTIVQAIAGDWTAAALSATGLVLNSLIMAGAYGLTRSAVARQSRLREDPISRFTVLKFVQIAALIPITQCVYAIGTVGALMKKSIQWRKVTYQVRGASEVSMLEYRPMQNERPKAQEVSI